MKDSQVSTKFLDEKVDFTSNAYSEGIQFTLNKVAAQYLELDLDFLDEFLGLEEGKVMANTST